MALVKNKDLIALHTAAAGPNTLGKELEIQHLLVVWKPARPAYDLGHRSMWMDQVTQVLEDSDFRFRVDGEMARKPMSGTVQWQTGETRWRHTPPQSVDRSVLREDHRCEDLPCER